MWKNIEINVNKMFVRIGQEVGSGEVSQFVKNSPQLDYEELMKKVASSLLHNSFTHIHTPNSNKFYI